MDIERRQNEAIQKVAQMKRVAELKQERELLKKQWRAHRAKTYLLDRCQNPELKEFLEQRKPRALPKLPSLGTRSPSFGVVGSSALSTEERSDEVDEDETRTGGATGSTTPAAADGLLVPTAPSSDKECKPSPPGPKGISNFLGRLRQTRMRATCSSLSEWKKRNGCRQEQKVFICCKGYPDFREALLRRGWFENEDKDSRHFDLKWGMSNHIDHSSLSDEQVVNHFDGTRVLTTKVGLTCSLRQSSWCSGTESDAYYPRAFDLYDPLERAEFVLNFKVSKAESILHGFLRDIDSQAAETFSQDVLYVAIKVCQRVVTDVDDLLDCGPMAEALGSLPSADWDVLSQVNLDDCTKPLVSTLKDDDIELLVSKKTTRQAGRKMEEEAATVQQWGRTAAAPPLLQKGKEEKKVPKKIKKKTLEEPLVLSEPVASFASGRGANMVQQARDVLAEMCTKSGQHCINGGRNAWIVKPSGKSRGRGIQVMRELDEIFKTTESDGFQWICQKYIEQPLLVRGYKFDIRQWVLVADWNPLTVYIWRQPYLRFAGQKYDETMSDRSEFKHLTNNSIMHEMDGFKNKCDDLDCHGYMWFAQQFQEYLHQTCCKCEKHHTPWLEPPPYTCDYFGVRWEDVMFVAREDDEEEEDNNDDEGDFPNPSRRSPERSPDAPASTSTTSSLSTSTALPSDRGSDSDGTGASSAATDDQPPSPTDKSEEGEASTNAPGGAEASAEEEDDDPDRPACEDLWNECLRPQFQEMIINSLLCVKDEIVHRKGEGYEVFGYDFMVSDGGPDGKPKAWLIEVNSSPACDYSTPVTCPLVKKMMEDTAKIMVDLKTSPDSGTGEWELIKHAHGKLVSCRTERCPNLAVEGKEIPPPKGFKKKKKKSKKKKKGGSKSAVEAETDMDDGEGDGDEESDADGDDYGDLD